MGPRLRPWVQATRMFVLIVNYPFILDDMKFFIKWPSNAFQITLCGGQEEQSCKTTNKMTLYMRTSPHNLHIHVVAISKYHINERS
jgi:hypothetical protein